MIFDRGSDIKRFPENPYGGRGRDFSRGARGGDGEEVVELQGFDLRKTGPEKLMKGDSSP